MTDNKDKIKNEIDDFLGDLFKKKEEIKKFIIENCVENGKINFKGKKDGKSIIGFALENGEIDFVNYLLNKNQNKDQEKQIEITQEDFDVAIDNGYYYIAKKISENNQNINNKNIKFEDYRFNYGKDYFNEKKVELEEKINIFLENKNLNKILNDLSKKFKNSLINKPIKNKNNIVCVIKELLLDYGYETVNSVLEINNDEIKNITNNLKDIINNNDINIKNLINDYVLKPLEIKNNNQQYNNNNFSDIKTIQSDMADIFKSSFNSYINRNKNRENIFDSRYLQYLINNDKYALSNKELSHKEFFIIKDILFNNQDNVIDKNTHSPIGLAVDNLTENDFGHFILEFNGNYLDDSLKAGVQTDNCCGVYAAHMHYIAETIYNKMIKNKIKFDYNIFKKVYDKYKTIYIKNAQKDNLDVMRKINCKNRLCIAAERSLDLLEGYISKETYNNLMNKIKEEIENSFITDEMKKELNNLDNNIKIEIEKVEKKIEKEKLEFKKKYIESFRITKDNYENIDNNIKKIKKGYYERKLKKIDNIKKIINTDNNKSEINKLIISGEISNRKIIESILYENNSNNSNKIINDKNFSKAVLPDIEVNGKIYSGFNGEANYNENEKSFVIKYNQDGFFDDKLNLMSNLSDELKKNLKQGLKIKLKNNQDNKKLFEIFTLLKTNPVIALLELNNISEGIYLGDKEIKNNEKYFNELVNIFGTISESRRQIIKLDNIIKSKGKKSEEKIEELTEEVIYAEIKTYMCNFLKEAVLSNEKEKNIISKTDFKDINIIISQSLELFKKMENKEELKNIFDTEEQSEELKTLLNVFRKENENEDTKLNAFMNCFNVFINFKLKKTKERIDNIIKQEELNIQSN